MEQQPRRGLAVPARHRRQARTQKIAAKHGGAHDVQNARRSRCSPGTSVGAVSANV